MLLRIETGGNAVEREIITSRANPLLTRVRKLNSRRSFRREEGRFAAEGPKLLTEALRWGAELEAVIFATGVSLPAWCGWWRWRTVCWPPLRTRRAPKVLFSSVRGKLLPCRGN